MDAMHYNRTIPIHPRAMNILTSSSAGDGLVPAQPQRMLLSDSRA